MPGYAGRRGNGEGHGGPRTGEGWGGEAKGAGGPGKRKGAGRPPGVKNGEGKIPRARAALEDAAPLAVETVISLAKAIEDPRALQAALAILNRVGMHEKSSVEHSGANGGPLIVERILVAPTGPNAEGI